MEVILMRNFRQEHGRHDGPRQGKRCSVQCGQTARRGIPIKWGVSVRPVILYSGTIITMIL